MYGPSLLARESECTCLYTTDSVAAHSSADGQRWTREAARCLLSPPLTPPLAPRAGFGFLVMDDGLRLYLPAGASVAMRGKKWLQCDASRHCMSRLASSVPYSDSVAHRLSLHPAPSWRSVASSRGADGGCGAHVQPSLPWCRLSDEAYRHLGHRGQPSPHLPLRRAPPAHRVARSVVFQWEFIFVSHYVHMYIQL